MLFVFFTILSSLAISVVMKISEGRGSDRLVVTGSNYVMAAGLGFLFTRGTLLPDTTWLPFTVLVGAGFVAGFLLLMIAIRRIGLAVPISVARISTLGPILLAVVVYDERPSALQLCGIVLGMISFFLLGAGISREKNGNGLSDGENHGEHREHGGASTRSSPTQSSGASLAQRDARQITAQSSIRNRITPHSDLRIPHWILLLAVFIVMVFNDFSMKVAQTNGVEQGSFLFTLFSTAALICLGMVTWRWLTGRNGMAGSRRPSARDILLGLLLGLPNYFSSWFLIRALEQLPASVVFPIVSAGGVVAITLAAVIVWRERLSRTTWIGIALAAIAVAALGAE